MTRQKITRSQKTKLLAFLGVADLTCFALGSMQYGEIWSGLGVAGLLLLLGLFEFL